MSSISKYNGQFIKYRSVHDYKEIWSFANEGKVYSNQGAYKSILTKLIEYEKKKKYTKGQKQVYAVELLLMFPIGLKKSDKHSIVKEFMRNISHKYKKDLLYIYEFVHIGKGNYCRLLAFQRQVYKKENIEPVIYKRDMWVNADTGRTCKRSDPKVIHLCKKGQPKKDAEGNIIYQKVEISPHKYRYLNFYTHNNDEKRLSRFTNFKDKLTKKLVMVISKVLSSNWVYLKLRHMRFKDGTGDISKRTLYYNSVINKINIQLMGIQEIFRFKKALNDIPIAWKRFEHVFYSLQQILNNGYVNFTYGNLKSEDSVIMISPNCRLKQETYATNLKVLEKVARSKIENWYFEEFDYSIYERNYLNTIFKTRKF